MNIKVKTELSKLVNGDLLEYTYVYQFLYDVDDGTVTVQRGNVLLFLGIEAYSEQGMMLVDNKIIQMSNYAIKNFCLKLVEG